LFYAEVIALRTLIEIAPARDITFILSCVDRLKEWESFQDDPAAMESPRAMEQSISAVFERHFTTEEILIPGILDAFLIYIYLMPYASFICVTAPGIF